MKKAVALERLSQLIGEAEMNTDDQLPLQTLPN